MIPSLIIWSVFMNTKCKRSLFGMAVCMMLITSSLHAESNKNIVKTIMKLRADVETIYSKIDEQKENYKSQIKSLAMQKADNEAQINRKETAQKLLESDIHTVEEKLAQKGDSTTSLKPMLMGALSKLEVLIQNSLPFKTQERLEDVQKIKTDLEQGNITEEKALSLTWASYDDTLRLTKEIGLFKQQITVNGEEKMAKIAKLGSVMMFFATPDDKVGYVVKKDNTYTFNVVTNENEVAQIVALFDALQKQIRTGYFSLPNALVLKGDK